MNNDQNNGFNSLYNNTNNTPKQTTNNPFDIIMDDEPEKDTFSNSINIVPLTNNKDNIDQDNWQNANNISNQNQVPNNFASPKQHMYCLGLAKLLGT